MKTSLRLALILGLLASPLAAFESANLIKNGGFDEIYDNGFPADWLNISHPNHLALTETTVSVVSEGPFLRVVRKTAEGAQLGEQRIRLAADVKQVRVAYRVRSPALKLGDADWQAPGLTFSWLLADNTERHLGPGSWLLLRYPVERWTNLETLLNKPEDAVGIRVAFQGNGWTGQVDFDDVVLEPL